jgi:hypothetical protein
MEQREHKNNQDDRPNFAEISGPIEWAKSLSPEDMAQLRHLLNLKAADFIKFYTEAPRFPLQKKDVAPIAGCCPGHITRIIGGANPTEEITRKLRDHAIFSRD